MRLMILSMKMTLRTSSDLCMYCVPKPRCGQIQILMITQWLSANNDNRVTNGTSEVMLPLGRLNSETSEAD